jgi:hypothetical protein
MRFMVLVKGDPDPGLRPPSREAAAAMARYLDDLTRAGVLLAAEALYPSASGSRIRFTGGRRRTVTDGPFGDPAELVVGSVLLLQASSRALALEWASRCPVDVALAPDEAADIEIRQVIETGYGLPSAEPG